MAAQQPHWKQCSQHECIGVQLPATAWCLAHAAEQAPDVFDSELKRISAEGSVDARGVVISAELLKRLLAAVPRKDGRPTFTTAEFQAASFQSTAGFGGARFQGRAAFFGASFQGWAQFSGASFQDQARFGEASFQDQAGFEETSFKGEAVFRGRALSVPRTSGRCSHASSSWTARPSAPAYSSTSPQRRYAPGEHSSRRRPPAATLRHRRPGRR